MEKVILGLDIGTTGISCVVLDMKNEVVLATNTIANSAGMSPEWIFQTVKRILDEELQQYPQITSIGITGQMHGVLYVDAQGQAVSPFYNWQDGRGDKNYCQEIFQKTGYTVFSGYGFATLYYNQRNQLEPPQAVSFCTIMDYVVMQLTGNRTPLMHPTNAASLGLYLLEQNAFDREAVGALGLSHFSLPEIAMEPALAGTYQGIPVGVAIGDNQASFYGSVKHEENTALVNFGTGSQISAVIDHVEIVDVDAQLEIRPYLFGKYLICGSALCGGKAYAILETFFSAYVGNGEQQYETMNRLAQKAYEQKSALHVKTQFSGTRKDPELKGSILDITENNFTPEQLILGVLQGMAEELKQYFDAMQLDHVTQLAASGNAMQKNPVLPLVLQDLFGLPVTLTENKEEAAIGAALYTRRVCYELE